MRTTRAYLRIWAPAATVALALTLPWAGAQARDCDRYPAACDPPAETQATADPAPRAQPAPKRKAAPTAKRPDKPRAAASASRETPREQPSPQTAPTLTTPSQTRQAQTSEARTIPVQPAMPAQPSRTVSQQFTTIDAAVLGAQPLTESDDEAFAHVGGRVGDGTDQAETDSAADPLDAARRVGPDDRGVKFVNANDANEIDLAAAEPDAADLPWLRYLLAALGAVTAAASTVRYFMF